MYNYINRPKIIVQYLKIIIQNVKNYNTISIILYQNLDVEEKKIDVFIVFYI